MSDWPATNNKKVLRRMLSDRDRMITRFTTSFKSDWLINYFGQKVPKWDEERRLIREKIKGLRDE